MGKDVLNGNLAHLREIKDLFIFLGFKDSYDLFFPLQGRTITDAGVDYTVKKRENRLLIQF